ncbi:glycosyl transferase [Alsobacter metallidurans]|uniref:Glycosyl transferase n=1 Tax=Alsobacter metallidurans TaxID=340221 RepID=A0A917I389_9HYPH|nr:glycosyl transferase [Alsobacter metallidurans]GGH05945.1 glycosyl transferase [Alsobacter metallidurans]
MPPFDALRSTPALALLAAAAAGLTWLVIPLLMPALRRYALARPNARSSHREPTPQGGGAAVAGVVVLLLVLLALLAPAAPVGETASLLVLCAAAAVLAALGAVDDIRPLPALPRLLVQAIAVAAAVYAIPADARVTTDAVPLVLERAVVAFAGLWFVNLTNFMDGLDWITVAEFLPVSVALAMLSAIQVAPVSAGVVAAALGGALLGFAPFNKPTARLFLGDVGSLPIGLLAGYALYRLACAGHLLPALILPLYYLADATITLLRRMARRERIWDAHRSHFYQQATTNGLSVLGVVSRVFTVNVTLAGVAIILAAGFTPARGVLGAGVAALSVAALLADFAQKRRKG